MPWWVNAAGPEAARYMSEAFAEFRQRVDAEAPPGQAIEKSLATLGGSVGLVLAHAKQNHLVVLDRIRWVRWYTRMSANLPANVREQ